MLVLALLGCPATTLPSDGGTLTVTLDGVTADPIAGLQVGSPLLAGTSFTGGHDCPSGGCPDEDLSACFTWTFDGPAEAAANVVTVTGAGEVVWHFEPDTCASAVFTPVEDTLTLQVVDDTEVTGRVQLWAEEHAVLGEITVESSDGSTAAQLVNAPGEPFHVLADHSVRLPVRFEHPDFPDVAVTYAPGQVAYALTTTAGPDGEVTGGEDEGNNYVIVTVPESTEATLHATLHGKDYVLGTFVGVPEADVASLAVAVGYVQSTAPGADRTPVGARAVVRDVEGTVIYGVPVAWTPDGVLGVVPDASPLPGPDYASLQDACVPPSQRVGARTARVDVAFGDLTATQAIAWNAGTQAGTDDGFAGPDPSCEAKKGCGCDASPTPWAGALAVLAALAGTRRRR